MMIKKFLASFLLLPLLSFGQGKSNPIFNSEKTGAPLNNYRVTNWQGENALAEALQLLGDNSWSALLDKSVESPGGKHNHYRLHKNNRVLAYQGLSIHQYKNGDLWIQYPDLGTNLEPLAPLEVDTAQLRIDLNASQLISEASYLCEGDLLVPGFFVNIFGKGGAHYQAFLTGDQVYNLIDDRRYASDSTCTALIFLPDPLSTANVNYGGSYVDNNDATNAALNSERFQRNFVATFDNGIFKLENADIKIDEFDAPVIMPVTSNTNTFNYTRDQSGFEDVNTFFHLTRFKSHIDSLGFTGLPGGLISVDVHAIGGSDQSYFTPQLMRIYMGEGGVDDAEDADVIIHEYAHSLVYGAAANSNRISERAGMEEAICDYFAISHSLVSSPNQRDRVFNWDGHNAFWSGRSAVSSKDYQTISFTSNIYNHTDLMASCLLEIRDNTNRATADRIILEALYGLQSNSTYRDFALMIIQADNVLNGGQNYQIVKAAFVRRNVLSATFSLEDIDTPSRVELFNTIGFLNGEDLILQSSDSELAAFSLMDIQGRLISNGNLNETQAVLHFHDLKRGIYFLSISTKDGSMSSFKVVR